MDPTASTAPSAPLAGVLSIQSYPAATPAVALGVAAGVLGWLWASRPVYYEVQEGDTLCDIAGCYNINYLDVFERNTDKLRDPDVIYPGDTLRIR